MLVRRFLRCIHIVAPTFALLFCAVILLGCQPAEPVPPSPTAPLLDGESSPVGATQGSSSTTATPTVSPPPTASITATRSAAPSATPTQVADSTLPTPAVIRAKIEIVWPHGGASVRDADLANITAYLISETGNDPPPCDWDPTVHLWAALNTGLARQVAIGEKRMFVVNGSRFPVWDFNDVDVSLARDAANKLTFFVTVDGVRTLHNIWVHAADARTIFPQQDVPTGVVSTLPESVDAPIEIVWPHDDAAIDQAQLANITGYLFVSGTKHAFSAGLDWSPVVRLHRSLNADTEIRDSDVVGAPRAVTASTGLSFMAWDFNDVDVSAAQDPLNQIFFWISVDGTPTFPNVWTHATEARTLFPRPDILNSCR